MSILVYRNNQQYGPYDDAQVIEMLKIGSLSADDAAIRQGGTEWKRLSELVAVPFGAATAAQATPVVTSASEDTKPKKSRTGLLLGCGGFLVIAVLVAGVLGFLAYRNLNPEDSKELRPATIGLMKLKTNYPPKGNIWGTETTYVALYGEEGGGSNSVIYMVTAYNDSSAAADNFDKDLSRSCKSDKPIRFNFQKEGKTVAVGGTCGAGIYVQRDNKVAVAGGSASASTLVEFADSMPLTADTTREKK